MTEQTQPYTGYGSPQAGASPAADSGETSIKDKAAESAQAGKQAAGDVAQTAAGQAKQVAGEAKNQARNLVAEARDQLRSHAGDQHRNAVTNLRSLGDELHSMASNSEQGGVATDLVGQAAGRTHAVADWLDGRQPEDLLDELRRFARRRPGAFLLGALAAGAVAGRLTRGAVAAHSDDQSPSDDATRPLPGSGATATYPTPAGYGGGHGGYETEPGRHAGAASAWVGGADPTSAGGIA